MPIFGVDGKFKSQFLVNFSDNFLVLMGNCFLIFESFSSQFIWSILMPIFGVDRKLQILIFESFSSQFIWSIFNVSTPFFLVHFYSNCLVHFQHFNFKADFSVNSWSNWQTFNIQKFQHLCSIWLPISCPFLLISELLELREVDEFQFPGQFECQFAVYFWTAKMAPVFGVNFEGFFFVFFQIFSPNLLFYFIFWLSFLLFPTNFDGII